MLGSKQHIVILEEFPSHTHTRGIKTVPHTLTHCCYFPISHSLTSSNNRNDLPKHGKNRSVWVEEQRETVHPQLFISVPEDVCDSIFALLFYILLNQRIRQNLMTEEGVHHFPHPAVCVLSVDVNLLSDEGTI